MTQYAYQDLCPGKIFSLYWLLQILFLIIGGYEYLIFKYSGVIYILICLFFFNLGPLSIRLGKENCFSDNIQREELVTFDEKKLICILCMLIFLGFWKPVHTILSHGFHLSNLLDFSSLLKINNTLAVSRYSGTLEDGGLFNQFLAVFSYSGPLVGGLTFPICSTSRNKMICYGSFLPLVFGGLTQGVKMGILASFFLFASGYIVSNILLGNNLKIRKKNLIYGCLSLILLMAILILSMMFRIGKFDLQTFSIVRGKFIAYAFGHLPAFDIWFDSLSWQPTSLTFGGKLFLGITNFLGIMKRESGLYQEFQIISIDGASTNVYTLFRILVDDFGIFLCPMFSFITGVFIQNTYYKLLSLINYKVYSTICAAFLFFTFWSFATSVFVYTTFLVVFLLFYMVLSICTKKVQF